MRDAVNTQAPAASLWRAPGRWGLLLLGGLAALALAVYNLVELRTAMSTGQLYDLGAFLASGRAVAHGLDPYAVYVWTPAGQPLPNLDPPAALPLFEILGRLSDAQARLGWTLFSGACYALVLFLLWRRGGVPKRRVLWALTLAGFWYELQLGQIYAPLALAATAAWLLLERRRPILSGLFIGAVAAVKPQLLVWPALLMLAGAPACALAALVSFAGLTALPLLRYGPHVEGEWLSLIAQSHGAHPGATNASLLAIGTRAGLPWAGWAAGACTAAVLVLVRLCRRPSRMLTSSLGIAGALVLSPISWLGYTMLLVPVLLARPWTRSMRLGSLMLLVPPGYLILVMNAVGPGAWSVLLGSLYSWALLLILLSLVREAWGLRSEAGGEPAGSPVSTRDGAGVRQAATSAQG